MDATFDYGNSQVPKSLQFKAIMKKYDVIGREMSVSKFYRDYVQPIEPKITLRQWKYFIDKFRAHVDKFIRNSAARALKLSQDSALSEANIEANSMKKILAITDSTLDDVLENPEKLNAIPVKERLDWFFKAMRARDSRTNVNIKKLTETRKINMYEDMMKGAQYGAIDADEINDPAEPPKQIKQTNPAVEIPVKKEVKEFSPGDLD